MVDIFYIFAILNAFAAFYWVGFLTLIYDVTTERNRIRFIGIKNIVFHFAGLSGPAVSGFIIARSDGLTGYTTVFILAFLMYVFTAIGSFYIKTNQTHHKAYYLRLVGLVMKKNKAWLKALCGWFLVGLVQGVMFFAPNILLLSVFGQEDLVGYVNVLFLSIAILVSYVISRIGFADQIKLTISLSVGGTLFATTFLFWDISIWSVMTMMILYHLFNSIQLVTFDAYQYQLISKLPLKGHLKIENLVAREAFMSSGRALAIFIVILLAVDIHSIWLPAVLFFFALLQLLLIVLVVNQTR